MAHKRPTLLLDRRALAVWTVCLVLLPCSCGETFVDPCAAVHSQRSRLGTLTAQSRNLVVDTENSGNFDGDRGRFKRVTADAGYLTYISPRGFERLTVSGYTFGPLPQNSWSLSIRTGNAQSAVNNTSETLSMKEDDFAEYQINGGANNWRKFEIDLPLQNECPPRVTIMIEGVASNNEFPGWGVQLTEIRLVQSWFEECEAPCKFKQKTCPVGESTLLVDSVENFHGAYAMTSNLEIDTTNAAQYFGGDQGRIKRTNNRMAELVYSSSQSFQIVEIEMYQYRPFNTNIRVLPYVSEACRPIKMTPVYKPSSRRPREGWLHRIGRFDLRTLPFCPKRVAIQIMGGQHGWELQLTRVTFNLVGTLEVNESFSANTRAMESGDDDDDPGLRTWWIWLTALLGAAFIFLLLAMIVHRVALCFGKDESSVYHISNFPYFRQRRDQEPPGLPDTPPIHVATSAPQPTNEPSFTFTPFQKNGA